MTSDFPSRWRDWAERAEQAIARCLPDPDLAPKRLHAAMRYAALGSGKRTRPLLVYATGSAFGAEESILDAPAVAVELIHAYSLVHDDLPAMDDDVLRRGRPTVHVAFDEATAILAGDALQSLAFEVVANSAGETAALAMLRTLAQASGVNGMVGGQALDMEAVGQSLDADALRTMHARKTGALIRAAVRMGGLAAGVDETTLIPLDDYADALGLAFQIRDDILDVEGDPALIGKTAGKDAAHDKPTYPAVLGMQTSQALLGELDQRMQRSLDALTVDASELRRLASFVVSRSR